MTLVGQAVGQYRIVAEIDSGGMATVYKAYQASLDRYVAVKVLAGKLANDAASRRRFETEAKRVANMSHPHILPVHDFGEQRGVVYIVTEFVEGGTLRDRLDQPLDPGLAARIASEIAQALDYAHRQGLIHRDVKPGNILTARDGRTLLADFGVVRVVAETGYTQTGTSVGTPAYMSPEQAKGEEIDGRSDLYSLGVVLYEMVTGRTPFRSDTPLGVLHQQVFSAPPPPRDFNSSVPRSLQKVILKVLAKDPEDRYRTGREMAQALERAVKFKAAGELPAALPEEALTAAVTPPASTMARRLTRITGRGAAKVGRGTLHFSWGLAKLLLRVLIVLVIVVLIACIAAAIGGSAVLASFLERTIPGYSGQLKQFSAYGQTFAVSEAELNAGVNSAVEPYVLDLVRDVAIDFSPPESVLIAGKFLDRPIHLQGRLELADGLLRVYVERLNGSPLYIIGGILSNGINRGIEALFDNVSFRLDTLEVLPTSLLLRAAGEPPTTVAAAPTPTLRPSPTAPPTEVPWGVLIVVNELDKPLRLELAGAEWQLAARGRLELELPVDSYPYVYTVDEPGYKAGQGTVRVTAGQITLYLTPESRPLPTVRAVTAATATPQITNQPKATRAAQPKATKSAQPKATSTVRPTSVPYCPHPGARIRAPGVAAVVHGEVVIEGAANIPGFEFYKIELGRGSRPRNWIVLGELHRAPVADGILGVWDSSAYPSGVYVVSLVVVDRTGNYKTCQVQVQVSR